MGQLLPLAHGDTAMPPFGRERLEFAVRKRSDLTPPPQPVAYFLPLALTRNRTTKIWIAHRHVLADKAEVLADRAGRIRLRFWLGRRRCRARPRPHTRERF